MQIQRKDFLERIIEEFAEVLATLAGLRKTRSYLAALELMDRTVGGIMGINEDVVAMLSPDSLRSLVAMDPLLDDNYRLMLVELLREKAEVLDALGRPVEAAAERELAEAISGMVSARIDLGRE